MTVQEMQERLLLACKGLDLEVRAMVWHDNKLCVKIRGYIGGLFGFIELHERTIFESGDEAILPALKFILSRWEENKNNVTYRVEPN